MDSRNPDILAARDGIEEGEVIIRSPKASYTYHGPGRPEDGAAEAGYEKRLILFVINTHIRDFNSRLFYDVVKISKSPQMLQTGPKMEPIYRLNFSNCCKYFSLSQFASTFLRFC